MDQLERRDNQKGACDLVGSPRAHGKASANWSFHPLALTNFLLHIPNVKNAHRRKFFCGHSFLVFMLKCRADEFAD